MCGRYYIGEGVDATELQKIIDVVNRRSNTDQVKTSCEIFPTDTVPIIANNCSMEPSAFAMSWGYNSVRYTKYQGGFEDAFIACCI